MTAKRPQTKNRGAADVRDQIIDYINRIKDAAPFRMSQYDGRELVRRVYHIDADDLIAWIRGMAPRASKRKGGMGRK